MKVPPKINCGSMLGYLLGALHDEGWTRPEIEQYIGKILSAFYMAMADPNVEAHATHFADVVRHAGGIEDGPKPETD